MNAESARKRLTARAEAFFRTEKQRSESLSSALRESSPAHKLTGLMDEAMTASAEAEPWHDLMTAIERRGVREGLKARRAAATETLLHYGFSMSTSLTTNQARHAVEMGLRKFLNATDGIEEIDDEEPAAATATS